MSTKRPRPKVMTLTAAAAERMREIMEQSENEVFGVRIGVVKGGCAGMEYTMEYAGAPAPGDEIVEDQGVRLLIDPKAILFLLGTEMDFKEDMLSSGFVFNNPNQTSACGCGISVEIRPADGAALGGYEAPARS
ncbi:MAG: iron-sulfur cluster assembly accessory protein [Rhizobiales bacterium]|nr:iron-sulfur cluster assembly accessory protein [Hyphomicrobiales bacterium]